MFTLIRAFVRHPVAPNLAMIIMVLAGVWALSNLTRQLLPAFQLNLVTVTVVWTGAAAEDVEEAVTQPLEDELLAIGEVKNVLSTSRDGQGVVTLEFPSETDMGPALDEVKERVSRIRNLPDSAEDPQVSQLTRYEPVSRFVVSGPALEQLRPLVRRFERELRAAGMSQLDIKGLPKEELAIQIPSAQLSDLNLTLGDIAGRVRGSSLDVPAGTVGQSDVARQLRTVGKQTTVTGFEQLPLLVEESGRLLTLGDVADIDRRALPNQAVLFFNGRPAVEVRVARAETEDAIDSAAAMQAWAADASAELPDNIDIYFYDETWRTVEKRIDLITDNALTGLALVIVVLYVFLNGRVAVWVAIGIPVAIMAAFMALYLLGGSINVMSLFAMVMALGIIVDDAIVVGEEAVTRYQEGAGPTAAAEQAAFRMFAPVTAASLTTIAAFLPLLTIGGAAGNILGAIPVVIICVVVASLIECFLVLPGHLRHSLQATAEHKPGRFRRAFDVAFAEFREVRFRQAVEWSVRNRRTTISIAVAGLIFTVGLLAGGRLGFTFFPQPDGSTIFANARFVAGSPQQRVDEFLNQAMVDLNRVVEQTGEDLIRLVIKNVGSDTRGSTAEHLGHLVIELVPGDDRETSNAQLIGAWRRMVQLPPGLESFVIAGPGGGPPGSDIEVELTGADPAVLKAAALELQEELQGFDGVTGIRDDTAFGKEQLVFELTPAGQAIGLTEQGLSSQLRAAFDGELVQIFQDGGEEVEVRVVLTQEERDTLGGLETLPIVLPNGETAPLGNLASLRNQRGFDTLGHKNGLLAITVFADVDSKRNNSNAVRGQLTAGFLPELVDRYGINYGFAGEAQNQRESVGDVGVALPLALTLIYLILAWVFASYTWPFAVLSVIPFGLVGALLGHWFLGFDVTLLSIFGFFGLSGIVINDSIILVTVYKQLRDDGMAVLDAAVEAGVRRFRAVTLTSITTVFGIMPLLFERSGEAEFLKPMVISLGFGLIFGTFMVLFLLPSLLVAIEALTERLTALKSRFPSWMIPGDPQATLRAAEPRRRTGSRLGQPAIDPNA
jgi:multidrug efflux pump subunit AcrB